MADPSVYVTGPGELVDDVVWRHYGTLAGRMLEQVYVANPGLARRGLRLPAGVRVRLPDIRPPDRRPGPGLFGGG